MVYVYRDIGRRRIDGVHHTWGNQSTGGERWLTGNRAKRILRSKSQRIPNFHGNVLRAAGQLGQLIEICSSAWRGKKSVPLAVASLKSR